MSFALRRLALPVAVMSVLTAFAVPATAANLIVNGGFEADSAVIQSPDPVTGWTASEVGLLGGVVVNSGSVSPVSGSATPGASSGNYYALLDLAAPSQMAFSQTFAVGAQPLTSASLSYSWFASYAGDPAVGGNRSGLDSTSNDDVFTIRVDILKSGAGAFSTDAADLVFSNYYTAPIGQLPSAWTVYSSTIPADALMAGQRYTLRFAAASNRGPLIGGIDDVALNVSAVPEPQAWFMLLAGLGIVVGVSRHRHPQFR